MATLVEKLRKAREQQVAVGGFTFTVRRPTDLEAATLHGQPIERLLRFVVGWENVKELDVLPGGSPVPLPFDADVAVEWLSDRPDLVEPLAGAVRKAYRDHVAALEAAAKN